MEVVNITIPRQEKVRVINLDYVLLHRTDQPHQDVTYKLSVIEGELNDIVDDMDSGQYSGMIYTGYTAQFKDILAPFLEGVIAGTREYFQEIRAIREELYDRNLAVQRKRKLQLLSA